MKRLVLGFILGLAMLPVSAGASGLWGGSHWVPSHFYRPFQQHKVLCGRRTSPELRGIHGVYRMYFQHCLMTEAPVQIYRWPFATATPTPLPEQGIIGGILGGTPTATPRPTSTPLPTVPVPPPATPTPVPPTSAPRATPTPIPTQTAEIVFPPVPTVAAPTNTALPPEPIPTAVAIPPSSDPAIYELSLLNATRAQYGAGPLTLNPTQSAGTATCVGSLGHSVAMAQSGAIWHTNPAYPAASFPTNLCIGYSTAGENVGEGSVFGDPEPMLQQLHNSMMAEGTSNCATAISHACNIINPAFRQVGIGIVVQNGAVWLTTDFLG